MSLNKTSNIIIVLLLLVMLWAAYYMVVGSFNQNLAQHKLAAEHSQGGLAKLESSIASLDAVIGKPLVQQKQPAVEPSPATVSVVPVNKADEAQKALMQKELDGLYARLESVDKNQAKVVESLESRLASAQLAYESLNARFVQVQQQGEELRLQNMKLNSQLVEVTGRLKVKEEEFSALERVKDSAENKEVVLLKGELGLQQKKLEKVSALYEDLKDKLKEFAAIIARKDAALSQKDKDIDNLKVQLNFVALKFQNLEKSLSQSEKNQIVLAQKLNQMKELNTTIQDYIAQADSYVASQSVKGDIEQINAITDSVASNVDSNDALPDNAARANELKKQVEVILQPQR